MSLFSSFGVAHPGDVQFDYIAYASSAVFSWLLPCLRM